jgi:tripartite-type tricarboxylate transporter receptor subunit TctC
MMRLVASLVACLALFGGLSPNAASAYPTRPVTLVLGFAPGGPSDVMARIFGKRLEQALGQPIVIENRSGAGGNIAGEMVARAAPDGYTLLLANSGILAANAALYKRTGYDAERDFTPITFVGAQANVLVINRSQDRHRPRALQRHRAGFAGRYRRPCANDVLLGVAGKAAD